MTETNRCPAQACPRAGHCGAKRLELRMQPFEVTTKLTITGACRQVGCWSHLLESLYHCIPVALYLYLSRRQRLVTKLGDLRLESESLHMSGFNLLV
jgi:hypothetical protein